MVEALSIRSTWNKERNCLSVPNISLVQALVSIGQDSDHELDESPTGISLFKQTEEESVKITRKIGLFWQEFPCIDSIISSIPDFKEKC